MQRLLQRISRDEDGEVQDMACLKRIERAGESDEKRAARLKQQELFIPQWPELAIRVYLSIKSFARPKNVLIFSVLGIGQAKRAPH